MKPWKYSGFLHHSTGVFTWVRLRNIILASCLTGIIAGCGSPRNTLTGSDTSGRIHTESNAHDHSQCDHEHDEDHREYGAWDTLEYPSADNLYRLMNAVAATHDTSDRGIPSLSDMFLANFSEGYMRYKGDSQRLAALKHVRNRPDIQIVTGYSDEMALWLVPRLARFLDLQRFDSARVFYTAVHQGRRLHYPVSTKIAVANMEEVLPIIRLTFRNDPKIYLIPASEIRQFDIRISEWMLQHP